MVIEKVGQERCREIDTELRSLERAAGGDFPPQSIMFATLNWRTADVYVMSDAEGVVSVSAHYFGRSPRKNAWGRYTNWMLAYTVPEKRRMGHATALEEFMELTARMAGLDRMRSLAQSVGGARLHLRMGHQFWGVTGRGELIVDTPLEQGLEWPSGIPERARSAANKGGRLGRMSRRHVGLALIDPNGIFRVDPSEDWVRALIGEETADG